MTGDTEPDPVELLEPVAPEPVELLEPVEPEPVLFDDRDELNPAPLV